MTTLGTIFRHIATSVAFPFGPTWRVRVTNVARLLRGLLPFLAASAAATAAALPASAAVSAAASQAVTRADQWWLTALHAPAALRAAPAAGRGVTVAVLSTGVDAKHPD